MVYRILYSLANDLDLLYVVAISLLLANIRRNSFLNKIGCRNCMRQVLLSISEPAVPVVPGCMQVFAST